MRFVLVSFFDSRFQTGHETRENEIPRDFIVAQELKRIRAYVGGGEGVARSGGSLKMFACLTHLEIINCIVWDR